MQRILKNLVLLSVALPGSLMAASATIDSNTTNQSIRGFGVSSAWCSSATIAPAASALWADDNTDGHAGLSILRTRIDPGGSFANEAAPMTQAKAQNPNILIWSTEWTPPAAYKNNNNVNGPGATNTFNNTPANSTAYANYLINYIKTIKASYGIDLYAVSPQNEPDWNTSYESCVWNATQFNDFVKTYFYPAIQSNSLPTKVMIPESFSDNLAMAATAMNDPITAPMVSIIGNHLYGGGPRPLSAGGWAHLTNQESWETEMSDVSGAPHDPGMTAALQLAGWMHSCMVTASMNAYLHWWIYSFNGSNEGLYGADCTTATRKLAAMGNFSKFVRPGWYRMGGTITGNAGVNISAYKNVVGAPGKFAIVAINTTASPVTQSFTFSNFNATSVTPWITDSSRALVRQAAVAVAGGTFSFSLPAQSLVSFVGVCPPLGSPTSTPTYAGTPTSTPTASPTPQSQLFDDFEDVNTANNWGGTWSPYAGTASAVTIAVTAGGGAPGSTLGRGVVTGNIGDYGGITATFSGSPRDLSNYVGISFMIKGSSSGWFQLVQPNIADGDNFGATFTATGAWTQVTIYFNTLTQRGFGAATTLTLNQIGSFQWASNANGAFNFEIDDVRLLGYGFPTATRTATRTATVTPTRTASPTVTANATFTVTLTSSASSTPTLSSTRTITPLPSPTQTPSRTSAATFSPSPLATGTLTQSSTLTISPGSTATTTVSRTATPTYSSTPSWTPISSSTRTSTPTSSNTPLSTPTFTRTQSPVFSPSDTSTLTTVPSQTFSPTTSMTATNTPPFSPTSTFTITSTYSTTPTYTDSSTPSHTPSFTSSITPSRTLTASPTLTQSPQLTPSFTASAVPTLASTLGSTRTPTSTVSLTSSFTATPTSTVSPLNTATLTSTATPVVILPTSTPGPYTGGKLYVLPNPVTGDVATLYPPYFPGTADVVVQIYSISYFKVAQVDFNAITWHPLQISLTERWGGRLPQGLYYVVFKAPGLRVVTKMLVMN